MCSDRKKPEPEIDEDAALFRRLAGKVRRLHDDRAPGPRTRPRPAPRRPAAANPAGSGADREVVRDATSHGPLFHASPGVPRKLIRLLKRGRIPPQDELDLHGMRVREAEAALERFLSECSDRRLSCVRVIHGKGLRTGGSVLKETVARWLALRIDVAAYCSAPENDGGTGAVHVLLKQ